MANTISVQILAETKGIREGIGQTNGLLDGLRQKTGKAGTVLKGVLGANIIGKGVQLAGDGIRAFTDVLGDSISEARESEKVGKTTAAIIKATGGAAKITADQVGGLATAISNKTGKDDEAIQQGANLLLTFKNVRNEVGKGNDVFNRATEAAVDLSAAGFGSIEGSSKMLGKALNDPIKGISALGRAGVTFSEDQKKAIKKMVETGDTLGAQKLIMKEVESQVGGVAAANATAGEKMAVMAGNLKEQFGTILLPYLDKAATFFTSTLGPAISKGLKFLAPAIDGAIKALAPVFAQVGKIIGPLLTQITGFFSGKGGQGIDAAGFVAKLEPIKVGLIAAFDAIKTAITVVGPIVMQVLTALVQAYQQNAPAIGNALRTVAAIVVEVAGVIQTVWTAIGPVVLPILQSVFTTIVTIVNGALQIVLGIVKTVGALLKGDWTGVWEGIKMILSGALNIIKGLISNILNQGLAIAKGILGQFGYAFSGTWSDILGIVQGALQGVFNNVVGKMSQIRTTLSNAWNTIKATVTNVWTTIVSSVTSKLASLASSVTSKINQIKAGLAIAWSNIKAKVSEMWTGIVNTVKQKIADLYAKVTGIKNDIQSKFSGAASWLINAGRDIIRGLLDGINGMIDSVRSKLSYLTNMIPDWKGPAKRDASLLTNAGILIMKSLVKGFDKGEGLVERQLGGLTKRLETSLSPTFTPRVAPVGSRVSLNSSAVSAGLGGGNTYSITVNAPVGSDGATIGRELVRCISEFERAGGRRRA